MTQSALAKERRELKEQQQRTLLEAIPKDLSRCGQGWRPAQACTSASVLHNSGLPAGIAPSKELHSSGGSSSCSAAPVRLQSTSTALASSWFSIHVYLYSGRGSTRCQRRGSGTWCRSCAAWT